MSEHTSEETGQASRPERLGGAWWPGLGQVLAGLAGVGVFAAGAAFLVGWLYTDAFYDELGVPTRALDLQPADYLTARVEIWYAFVAACLGALLTVSLWAYDPLRAPCRRLVEALVGPQRLANWGPRLLAWTAMATAFAGAYGVVLTGHELFLYAFATGAVFTPLSLWALTYEDPKWRPVSMGVAVIAAIVIAAFLVPLAAGALGRHDAEALLAGPEEGSGARFVAAEPLGLPGERYESDVYVTESVGVVRATDNAYFVVVRGTQRVYCLSATRVLRVEYTPHEGR